MTMFLQILFLRSTVANFMIIHLNTLYQNTPHQIKYQNAQILAMINAINYFGILSEIQFLTFYPDRG